MFTHQIWQAGTSDFCGDGGASPFPGQWRETVAPNHAKELIYVFALLYYLFIYLHYDITYLYIYIMVLQKTTRIILYYNSTSLHKTYILGNNRKTVAPNHARKLIYVFAL